MGNKGRGGSSERVASYTEGSAGGSKIQIPATFSLLVAKIENLCRVTIKMGEFDFE